MKILSISAAAALFLAITGPVQAGDISVSNAWARASIGMARAGAAYLTLNNTGKSDDRLVSASADVSRKTELHTHLMDNGIMRMRQVKGIDVPAGAMAVLKPGGLHIMFIGLKAPLKEGKSFALKLNFEKSDSVETHVKIGKGGAMMMDHSKMDHGNMDHGKMKMKKMGTQ